MTTKNADLQPINKTTSKYFLSTKDIKKYPDDKNDKKRITSMKKNSVTQGNITLKNPHSLIRIP